MINRFRLFHRLTLLITFAAASIVHADPFPSPGRHSETSLLGIPTRRVEGTNTKKTTVELDGPRQLKVPVGTDDWDIRWFRVAPGSYTPVESANLVRSEIEPGIIEVPPGSVIVAPLRLVLSEQNGQAIVLIEPSSEEDRQRAAIRLGKFYNFPSWEDRQLVGFGTLRPEIEYDQELFELTITASIDDAEVFIDDVLAGTSPLSLTMVGGKHKVLFRADGYDDETQYLRLERDAALHGNLSISAEAPLDTGETYRTIVGSFEALGEANEQIAKLFGDTLAITLEEDRRLTVFQDDVPWIELNRMRNPDYAALEESGTDLLVTGTFSKNGNTLQVQADLYDIQAETVKAGLYWTGDIGLGLFDAMDEIAEAFGREVDKALPEAGRVLVTRTETIYQARDDRDVSINRKRLTEKRWREHPHGFSIGAAIGGYDMAAELESGGSTTTGYQFSGLSTYIYLGWLYDVGRYFSLETTLFVQTGESYQYSGDMEPGVVTPNFMMNPGLQLAPQLVFRNTRSDIFLSAIFLLRWIPEITFGWIDGIYREATVGSFLAFHLPLSAGFRYYFNSRVDKTSLYIQAQFGLSFINYVVDLSGRSPSQFTEFGGEFALKFGVKL